MAKYFKNPFGVSGDRGSIPEATPPDGSISYTDGFGVNYQLDPLSDSDALNIPRLQFNQMMYDVTLGLQQYQQNGFPDFITTSDNGGTPYSYGINAHVRYDDGTGYKVYYSLVDANTSLPTDTTKWGIVVYSPKTPTGTTEIWPFATIKEGGYVWLNGTTIGSATSGATQRANADTFDLYAKIWGDYSNTVCPIFTSAGSASTRGVSAAADFAANKRLSLPDWCGCAPFFMDNMGGIAAKGRITSALSGISGVTLGARGGAEVVALTESQLPAHLHTGTTSTAGSHAHTQITLPASEDDNPDPPLNQSVIGNNIAGGPATYATNAGTNAAGDHAHTFNTSSVGEGFGHQNMPPAVMAGGIIMKL